MYLVNTKSYILFVVNDLSKYMVDLRHVHWIETKHVLMYLKGTIGYGIIYVSDQKMELHGYIDSNWAESVVDKKNTSGFCFSLGSGMISWYCRKQTLVALNIVEAEYIAACGARKKAMWL